MSSVHRLGSPVKTKIWTPKMMASMKGIFHFVQRLAWNPKIVGFCRSFSFSFYLFGVFSGAMLVFGGAIYLAVKIGVADSSFQRSWPSATSSNKNLMFFFAHKRSLRVSILPFSSSFMSLFKGRFLRKLYSLESILNFPPPHPKKYRPTIEDLIPKCQKKDLKINLK